MPRIPNTRPTLIYWLYDTRTNEPFYCGKTVTTLERRLVCHFGEASRAPNRPVLIRLMELGADDVRIELMETVPANGEWGAREKHWIAVLRWINPNCQNVSSGGAGAPGVVLAVSTRNKMSVKRKGKTHSPESRALMSIIGKQRMACPDARDKISTKLKGRTYSDETRSKMSAGQKARFARSPMVHSHETRAKQSEAAKTRGVSPGCRAGHAAFFANTPPETRAKMSDSAKRRWAKTAAAPG